MLDVHQLAMSSAGPQDIAAPPLRLIRQLCVATLRKQLLAKALRGISVRTTQTKAIPEPSRGTRVLS
jgi:hypothetical protein